MTDWSSGILLNTTIMNENLVLVDPTQIGEWRYTETLDQIDDYWRSLVAWSIPAVSNTIVTARCSLDNGRTWTPLPTSGASLPLVDGADYTQSSITYSLLLQSTDGLSQAVVSSFVADLWNTPDSTKRMLTYIPEVFRDGTNIRAHLRAGGAELDQLYAALEKARANLYPTTATSGGGLLDAWERVFNVPNGNQLTDTQRQLRLSARLSGQGVCNRQRIQDLCSAYVAGTVVVVEDPYSSQVFIRFVTTKGEPALLADLELAVAQQLPANVGAVFEITYIDWATRDAQNRTWTNVDALNWTWAQREVNP